MIYFWNGEHPTQVMLFLFWIWSARRIKIEFKKNSPPILPKLRIKIDLWSIGQPTQVMFFLFWIRSVRRIENGFLKNVDFYCNTLLWLLGDGRQKKTRCHLFDNYQSYFCRTQMPWLASWRSSSGLVKHWACISEKAMVSTVPMVSSYPALLQKVPFSTVDAYKSEMRYWLSTLSMLLGKDITNHSVLRGF